MPSLSPAALVAGSGLLGAILGAPLGMWAVRLTPLPGTPEGIRHANRRTVALCVLASALLFAGTVHLMHVLQCQHIPEVQADWMWRIGRIVSHLVLVSLLIVATATDFRDYTIPDSITAVGAIFGLIIATVSGDVQVVHVWVDWHAEIPGIRGPEIPEWIRHHPHWHGLVYSLAGMAAGAGVTGVVRGLSAWILGREALGLGDVTLMAMIGSFLGWQPVLIAFVLAPAFGLVVGVSVRLLGGKSYLPYGPWLAMGAVAVMGGWRWIWMFETAWSPTSRFAVRRFFSDGIGLAIVAGIAMTVLAALLVVLRLRSRLVDR